MHTHRSLACLAACAFALTLFGTPSAAMAGAYGEPEQATERPVPPPPPAAPAPQITEAMPAGPDYARRGFYAGLGAVYAIEDFDDVDGFDFNFDNSWGYNARAGYRFHPHMAVELMFEHYLEFEDEFDGVRTRGTETDDFGEIEVDAWSLMAIFKAFFATGCVQPYVSVGTGLLEAEVDVDGFGSADENDFAARFGAGVDGYITENLYVTAEVAYLLATGKVSEFDMIPLSLGFGYRF